jgi:hypothetical protein
MRPSKAREFFNWLESQQIKEIEAVTNLPYHSYFDYLRRAPEQEEGRKLSKNSLRATPFNRITEALQGT